MGPLISSSSAMEERSASSSSYFTHLLPSCRLLLRVYSAEGLRHVSSHGTYCKLYIGRNEMVSGSGTFARQKQKLSSSTSSHSIGELLQSSFGSSRMNTVQLSTTPLSSTSSSEGNLSDKNNKMRVLKTKVQKGKRSDPVWNEKFDIPVLDLNEAMLSIRVKSARLMSSPAIGACSVSLKHLMGLRNTTIDRWIELRQGKKDAGRIRLQLRLVDPSIARLQDNNSTTRGRNQTNSDTYLSLPGEETFEDIAKRSKKMSRRDHKYYRSARHFDGRPVIMTPLGSSSGSNRSASDKDDDQKRLALTRNNSATSNESIDDSEPASDVSISPVVSPRPNRASKEDSSTLADSSPIGRGQTAGKPVPSVLVASGLDTSYEHRGTMRRSELERTRMSISEILRTSRESRPSRAPKQPVTQEEDDDDDDEFDDDEYEFDDDDEFYDEYDNGEKSIDSSIGNHTKSSVVSSTLESSVDARESSRMDFDDDDDDDDEWGSVDKREKSVNSGTASYVLSSAASSTIDPRESSRYSFNDSESDYENDEVNLEKAREQQRQQWQMEQRKMQLSGIKEVSQSMSDDESDDDFEDEDDYGDDLVLNSPRMQFRPTITTLLGRESMNVLFEEEDDEEESFECYKMSEEFIPMLEASSPMSVDSLDCPLLRSSFD
ncbi:unnamed protein product [Peronospora effusa]|nr:unnamed protein product [Peronospora effusa]